MLDSSHDRLVTPRMPLPAWRPQLLRSVCVRVVTNFPNAPRYEYARDERWDAHPRSASASKSTGRPLVVGLAATFELKIRREAGACLAEFACPARLNSRYHPTAFERSFSITTKLRSSRNGVPKR
jgi:hypothetical protein